MNVNRVRSAFEDFVSSFEPFLDEAEALDRENFDLTDKVDEFRGKQDEVTEKEEEFARLKHYAVFHGCDANENLVDWVIKHLEVMDKEGKL